MSALLIVDVQNDFVNGSLAVPNGESIVPLINCLANSGRWDYVVATKDWHPPNHVSFASNHPGLEAFQPLALKSGERVIESKAWPDHCVQNSAGAELVPSLDLSSVSNVVQKGTDPQREFYSAFEDVFHEATTELDLFLRQRHVRDVAVVGLAEDFCVMNTALDAARLGYSTTVILDATKPITPDGAKVAEERLVRAGVRLQTAQMNSNGSERR